MYMVSCTYGVPMGQCIRWWPDFTYGCWVVVCGVVAYVHFFLAGHVVVVTSYI